jgi:hypothetical protein
MKTKNLVIVGVSSCVVLFLIFFMLKKDPIDPCDCVDLMFAYYPVIPINSLKDWELSDLKEKTNWTEEQIEQYRNCENKFQSYDNVNFSCTEKKFNEEKRREMNQ